MKQGCISPLPRFISFAWLELETSAGEVRWIQERTTYPQHKFHLNEAVWAGMIQLKSLIQSHVWVLKQVGETYHWSSQGTIPIFVFYLGKKKKKLFLLEDKLESWEQQRRYFRQTKISSFTSGRIIKSSYFWIGDANISEVWQITMFEVKIPPLTTQRRNSPSRKHRP